MIPLQNSDVESAVHLRFTRPDGSSKDWIGSITTGGVVRTYWGKTGAVNQTASKPQQTHTEFGRLIQEKLQKGYVEIDSYSDVTGWSSSKTQVKPDPPKKTPKPPKEKLVSIMDKMKPPEGALEWDF